MTPEEQRIAIAMACGMVVVPCTCCANPWKSLSTGKHIPNYLNDLNAMHEAENTLSPDQCWLMSKELDKACGVAGGIGSGTVSEHTWHATAAQRAEAFLKTLNLWKDQ